jgi:polyisoprenoid-binding protein YceI
VSVRIPVASVDTGVPALDAEFQSAAFFDAAAHPQITFESRVVRFTGLGNTFEVEGDLTVRGVTRPVILQARLNGSGVHPMTGAPVVGFAASTRIKRSDYGLEVALPMVSDDIDVQITLEASPQQEARP